MRLRSRTSRNLHFDMVISEPALRQFEPTPHRLAYRVVRIIDPDDIDFLRQISWESSFTDHFDDGSLQLRIADDLVSPQLDLVLELNADHHLHLWVLESLWEKDGFERHDQEWMIRNFLAGAVIVGYFEDELKLESLNEQSQRFLRRLSQSS